MNKTQSKPFEQVTGWLQVNLGEVDPVILIGLKSSIVELLARRGVLISTSDIWTRGELARYQVGRE
jgi:hypothetical protein